MSWYLHDQKMFPHRQPHLQQLHQLLLLPRLPQLVSPVTHLLLQTPPAAAEQRAPPSDLLAAAVLLSQHLLAQLEATKIR